MLKISKNKLYQVYVFERKTKKRIKIIGEHGLTPKKLDEIEADLVKSVDWKNFWIETVEFVK